MPDFSLNRSALKSVLGISNAATIVDTDSVQTVINKILNVDAFTLKHSTTNAVGDLLKGDGTKFTRFPRGTANQVLAVNGAGTDLVWTTIATGGGNVNTGQANTYGDFDQIFRFGRIKSMNSGNTFNHAIQSLATANRTWSLPDISDTSVGLTATQTLTNKTISGASNTVSNIPDTALSSNVSLLNTAQTITAADTFNDQTVKLRNPAGTFSYTLVHGAILADRLLNLPLTTATDTLAAIATPQTLTNKIINATNNTLTDTSTALGDILKSDGTKFTRLGKGTANQVLAVNSGGTDIAWTVPAASTGVTTFNYYIYIDAADSNKYKAKNLTTGVVDFTSTTSVDSVINGAIDALSTGSTIGTTGDTVNLWTGGKYGAIFVGPGTFNVASSIILKSNIMIMGCGPLATVFKLAASTANNANSTIMKSSLWDSRSYQGSGLTSAQLQQADTGIVLLHFSIDGNKKNNTLITQTDPNVITSAGATMTQHWGHGIAIYGSLNYLEDIWVHHCVGAGIILQIQSTNFGSTGATGTGQYPPWSNIFRNISCWWNLRHGMLIRAPLNLDGYNSYYNGEPGLDVQHSGYFNSTSFIGRNLLCFYDSVNHGTQTSTTYDATGFEVRILGYGPLLTDSWIEAPFGYSDNLVLGLQDGPTSVTNYNLLGSCSRAYVNNVHLDSMRASGLLLTNNAYNSHLKVAIEGVQGAAGSYQTLYQGCHCKGFYNDLDLDVDSMATTPGNTKSPALVMGTATQSTGSNIIRLRSTDNNVSILWSHAGNYYNSIDMQLAYVRSTHFVIDPAGAAVNYATNTIKVDASSDVISAKGHNGGLATFSGTGAQTSFVIPHQLYAAPQVVNVVANTADARGVHLATADATNITVTYATAPITGTSNVKLWWEGRVSP